MMARIWLIDPKGLFCNPASSQAKKPGKILSESGEQTFRVWTVGT